MRHIAIVSIITFVLISCSDNTSKKEGRVFYPYSNDNYDLVEKFEKEDQDDNIIKSPEEYINWVESNKAIISNEKQIGELNFGLLLKPLDYVILNDLDTLSYDSYMLHKNKYDGMQYYVFTIGLKSEQGDLLKSGLASIPNYSQLVEYLAFHIEHDLKLIDGDTELECSMFHFERTYGLRPYVNFMLAFPRQPQSSYSTKTLVYDDKIFNTGIVKLSITSDALECIPFFQEKGEGL